MTLTKQLTKVTDPARHRFWAELAGDSRLETLRFNGLGWVPRKAERVIGAYERFAVCVLRTGSCGTFRDGVSGELQEVRGPGVFFVSPGEAQDYGLPVSARSGHWEEFYWIVEGERVAEWTRTGWWVRTARFFPVSSARETSAWELFRDGCAALEGGDARALDCAKIGLERWLSEGPWADLAPTALVHSPITKVVEMWRRDLAREWSLPEAAKLAGLSYSRFRARFVEEYGCGPHAHLVRLRLELARRCLHATDEPVKAVALRCGFSCAETFIRAFAQQAEGVTPGRWRERETRRGSVIARDD